MKQLLSAQCADVIWDRNIDHNLRIILAASLGQVSAEKLNLIEISRKLDRLSKSKVYQVGIVPVPG